jgi:hypothetical protein
MEFFAKLENQKVIQTFMDLNPMEDDTLDIIYSNLNRSNFDAIDIDKVIHYSLLLIVRYMKESPEEFDKYCSVNIAILGERFINMLNGKHDVNADLLAVGFRFLFELYLSCGYDLKAPDYDDMISFIAQNTDKLVTSQSSNKFDYILKTMPIYITKKVINNDAIEQLASLDSQVNHINLIKDKIDNFEESWDASIKEREVKINALEAKLKKYEQGFNFVALYDGFKSLSDTKKAELSKANFSVNLWILVCSFLPVIGALSYYFTKDIYVNIPLASMLLLSIMFYRVAIINHKSIKSQILQLDLRKTLCQFIQDYAEYSEELKSKNQYTLQKFEDMIFSGLVANEEQLPTSFDGVDQISKLVKALKK